MGYTHFDRVSAVNGFAVGKKGSEQVVIDSSGTLYRDCVIVQAHKSSVSSSQDDVEIFEFTAPVALTLVGVQVYCTAVTATASVNVKEAGTSVLSSAVTPAAGDVVDGTISDADIAKDAAVTVHATTDANGSITDLTVTLLFKAAHV